jgi:aminopeptidase YwaD
MRLARFALLLLFVPATFAQTAATKPAPPAAASAAAKSNEALQRSIRAHMEYLASDALRGRGSATEDELKAAQYIAAQFQKYGIQPAGDADAAGKKTFIQNVPLTRQKFTAPPTLSIGDAKFTHGKDMAIVRAVAATFTGPLQKWKPGDTVQKGAAVYLQLREGANDPPVRNQMNAPFQAGAAMVIIGDAAQIRQRYAAAAGQTPELPVRVGAPIGTAPAVGNAVILNAEATKAIEALADGAQVTFAGETAAEPGATRNVIGVLPGSDPTLAKEVILLTAHMDHIGTRENAPGEDKIYNGADDDASGCVAVLELARRLGASKQKPKRTVYFVTFGSEERGGWGANYFLEHPPVPLTAIAANLEFEMIGRGDSAVPADTLWLTGFDRTNLGPELAKQGAKIVADPHPDQQFFMRSDNYALAKRGVVAQTVSSFGLHKDYHQPSDDASTIDYDHMTRSIESIFAPVEYLANSGFRPEWLEGKKP